MARTKLPTTGATPMEVVERALGADPSRPCTALSITVGIAPGCWPLCEDGSDLRYEATATMRRVGRVTVSLSAQGASAEVAMMAAAGMAMQRDAGLRVRPVRRTTRRGIAGAVERDAAAWGRA